MLAGAQSLAGESDTPAKEAGSQLAQAASQAAASSARAMASASASAFAPAPAEEGALPLPAPPPPPPTPWLPSAPLPSALLTAAGPCSCAPPCQSPCR